MSSSLNPGSYQGFVAPNNSLRNIQLQSGDPAAILNNSRQLASSVGSSVPTQPTQPPQSSDQFQSIIDLLKNAQQGAGTGLYNAQVGQIQRGVSTPSSLIGASPGQQDSARSASMDALNPTIGGYKDLIDKATNAINDYKSAQQDAKSNAQSIIHDAMAAGSEALSALITSQPDLVKQAGYSPETLQGAVKGLQRSEGITSYKAYGGGSGGGSRGGGGGGGGGGGLTTPSGPVVDPKTDATVRAIIASNPPTGTPGGRTGVSNGAQWDAAATAIDKQFGAGTATKYDSWLKGVYEQGQNINDVAAPIQVGNYSPLTGSRYALQATRIAKNFIDLPIYQATANGQVYLNRISSAAQNPGSVGDAELLDSIVKLNTSGNAVTNEQVQLITGYGSFADKLNVFKNKVKNGGALSDSQRRDLANIAKQTFSSYKAGYQPVYNQVTRQLTAAGIPKAFWTIPDLNSLSAAANTGGSSSGGSDYQAYLKAIGK